MATHTAIQEADDLEALFDSILAANNSEASAPRPTLLAAEIKPVPVPAKSVPASTGLDQSAMINQIGHMTRALHNSLRELGLNKEVEKAAATIPDARDRLNYVATLTHQAAERVLNAAEATQPIMQKIEVAALHLSGQWQLLFEKKLDVEKFKNLVTQTCAFLHEVPGQTKESNAYLMEIIMAQDYQDLTGQVIKKIISLTQDMEQQLVFLLVETAPPAIRSEQHDGLLNGPVINAKGRTDVLTSQDQVDDLLESLGF